MAVPCIDPILLEVLRNRLDTIADEMELTLLKSSVSLIVKEALDASAALFTLEGVTIAQAASIPIHLGALQFAALRLLRKNVRLPDIFTGDLMAQVAACRLGGARLRDLLTHYGTATVLACIDELLTRAEVLTRHQLASIPDGTYTFTDYLDDDGVELDRPVTIAVAITVRGSSMTFDFTGTSPQVRGPFNSVPVSTFSAVYYAVRAICDPSIPNNGGCFRPVDIILPEGSVVNPRPPAPVACRTATIKRIADTIMWALVKAIPGRL